MTTFKITIESCAIVEQYIIEAPSEFQAKVKAFEKFYKEYPNREIAQVTKIEYIF